MNKDKELEEAIKILEKIKNNYLEELHKKEIQSIETVLKHLEYYQEKVEKYKFMLQNDVIPKKKIRQKLKEVQLPNVIVGGRRIGKTLEYGIKLGRIKAYEELLEG